MLSGDTSILQKSTEAKRATERAEAKEQAQIDIMAWITDKTSKNEDSTLDDSKVKDILTGKSYVKTANATSFITTKGEYEIPYSELYTASDKTPVTPDDLSTEWEIVEDYGATGLSLGDLIAPTIAGVTTEQFYVIGIDGTGDRRTVRLLTKYCVDWDNTNVQNSTIAGLPFRSDYTADDADEYVASDIKAYAEAYADELAKKLTLLDVETEENGSVVSGTKARLMWGTDSSGEIQDILSINETGTNSITGSTIVYGPKTSPLNYWLGTGVLIEGSSDRKGAALVMGFSGFVGCSETRRTGANPVIQFGLRPVIKVLASKIS